MTIFQKKNKIQEDALNSWRDNKFKSLIAMCTGSGKTRVGVLAAKYVANLNPNAKILVVVPTETLRDEGWKEEFKKWESEILYDTNVDTKCYVSIKQKLKRITMI
jgi:superfamily II DNA or RNA helicase